jgi:hypothetical protein
MPGQDGQLAGRGDHRGLEATAGLDPLVERPQRPGGSAGRPRGLDQHPAHLRPAGLADPTVHRGRVARLTHLRVQPHVGHESVGIWEAVEVPDRGHDRHAGDRVNPGNGHRPRHHRIGQCLDGKLLVHHRQLGTVEVQLPQQRVHAGAFVGRQRLHRQPVPARPAEQIRHRRSRGQVARQDCMNLVFDPGPLPNQVSAAGDLPTQRPGPIVRQPHWRQKVSGQQLRKNPGIDLVGLDLRLRDHPGLRRVRHHHPACQRDQQGRDRVAVAGGLQRHLIIGAKLSSPLSQRLRRDRDPALISHQAIFNNRELGKLAVHIHSDIAHHSHDSLP